MAGGKIAYGSLLQKGPAQLSTETEFMTTNDAGKLTLFLCSILWNIGIPQIDATTCLYKDNDACTAIANS